jgi:hypothetical protein
VRTGGAHRNREGERGQWRESRGKGLEAYRYEPLQGGAEALGQLLDRGGGEVVVVVVGYADDKDGRQGGGGAGGGPEAPWAGEGQRRTTGVKSFTGSVRMVLCAH